MPRHRPPREVWSDLRRMVWTRDVGRCVRCGEKVSLAKANIDHIHSGKRGDNGMGNLRTLCRRCHVLREDIRHRGMVAKALADGIIPPDWRSLVWSDEDSRQRP